MEKQTKNIITNQSIEKDLLFYNMAAIKSCLVLTVVFLLLAALGAALLGLMITECFNAPSAKAISLAIIIGLSSLPVWFPLLDLIARLFERRILLKNGFEVVTARVLYKIERPHHRHVDELLCFTDYGECVASHTTYQLASAGDEFYLVVVQRKKPVVKSFFSQKSYEYRED